MKPKANNRLLAALQIGTKLTGLGSLLFTISVAAAGTAYWDTNNTIAGSGNIGSSWEGFNWTTDSTGITTTTTWTNGDDAVFSAGTDGTGSWSVGLSTTVTASSITFAQTGSKTINGGTINIGGGSIDSTALGFAPGNQDDIFINSVLAGSGGLTIAANGDHLSDGGGGGGAELRLGGANTFSDGLTITNGLVSFGTDDNLGDPSNIVTLDGGGLLVTGTTTTSRAIEIDAGGGTFRGYGGSSFTVNGNISNASGVGSALLRRTDGGTVYLNGSGAGYTGTLLIGGGWVVLGASNANWSNTDIDLHAGTGAFVPAGGGTAVVNSITSSADVIIDNGTTLDVDTGAITLIGAHWYKTNAGTLGKLTSSSGTLTITNGSPTGDLTGTDHQIRVQVADFGATPVTLVKNNNNQLYLNEANSHSGGTIINGGRVQAGNAAGFGSGDVTVNPGAQAALSSPFPYANDFSISGNGVTEGGDAFGAIRFVNTSTVSGTVNVAAAARVTATGTNDHGIIAGPLTGSAALEKTGPGSLAITGDASGYTGTVSVNGGLVTLDNTLGGDLAVNDGGFVAGEGTVAGELTLGSSGGADIHVNGLSSAALSTTDLTVNGETYVHLTALPAVPGSAVTLVNYSGTLSLSDTLDSSFWLVNASDYRGTPIFADTGTAITMTVPAGDNLVWRGDDGLSPTFWDTDSTANWNNTTSAINPDLFYAGDNVLFDDTGVSKTVAIQGLISPATVTFNNSTGNDYTFTPGGGIGFTGPTNVVKNGTGVVALGGWSHNYTGTVTINAGVLRSNGSNETLGNASAVTINDGGQLDVNGQQLGAGVRHYDVTIAGAGPDGLGAVTNSNGNGIFEYGGMLNLTLSANASVGGNGGRFDFGRSGGLWGTIEGNSHTLTKVGSGTVTMRAPASDITYVVNAGTLKFEDYDSASGSNAITVNAGTLQSYGNLTFGNTLSFAAGTTLHNDGGGSQTWSGPVNLTGTSGDTVNLDAGGGPLTVSGLISGASNINAIGGNILYLTGADSNTYSGNTTLSSTGQLVLSKTGGAVAIPGDLYIATGGVRAIVSTTQDNQFGANSVLRFGSNGDNRIELKGTSQTVAGIDNTTAAPGFNCIQHSEYGAPAAVDGVSDLIVNVSGSNSYTFNGVLRDYQGGQVTLTKSGTGTQTIQGNGIDFTGATTVTEGRLVVFDCDDSWTSGANISAGAVYEANVQAQAFKNLQNNFTISGAGTYQKTGFGAMSIGWSGASTVAMASGGLLDITEGTIRLEYGEITNWTTNLGDLAIASGAAFDLWSENTSGVFVDALTGSGSVTRNFGITGSLTVGVDNGSGDFSGSISNASGTTHLIKAGSGTQTLSGVNTYTGNTTVNAGTLALAGTGSLRFVVGDASNNQITGSGTVTINGSFDIDTSAVTVGSGTWTLVNTSTLTETFGGTFSLGAGWSETSGVWTMTDGDQEWTFTEATGVLALSGSGDYASWIDGFFPGETNPAIIGADADPDQDGIPNGVEMVTGGNPATGMDTALLPSLQLVTNPAGVPAGNYFLFTYRRADLSVTAGVTAGCEYDANLVGPWTLAQDGVDGVTILEDNNYDGSFVPPATDTDRVRVYIPRGANSKLFGRLNVEVP